MMLVELSDLLVSLLSIVVHHKMYNFFQEAYMIHHLSYKQNHIVFLKDFALLFVCFLMYQIILKKG